MNCGKTKIVCDKLRDVSYINKIPGNYKYEWHTIRDFNSNIAMIISNGVYFHCPAKRISSGW